jgi:uncharacterized protein DUF6683
MNAIPTPDFPDLSFGDDAEISARVRDELAATLGHGDAERMRTLREALEARDFHAEFAAGPGMLGLDSHDLAGVMAAYWLVMWSLVHDVALPSAEDAAPVHAQVARMIGPSPLVRERAQRQAMGEAMLSETMLTHEQVRDARARGDETALAQMAETAQRNMLMRQALNLKKMRLTRSGLAR